MSFLLEAFKKTAEMAGSAALTAGQITKLKAEILLAERDVRSRKQAFGVELYDFIAPLASRPDFFAANDKMTDTIRGPFLAAQREIAALFIRRGALKEKLAQAEITRKAAFPTAAQNFAETVYNAGKTAAFTGNEAKIKTEISMVDTQITAFKHDFGLALFDVFVKLEDSEGWLPTVREVRSMYDNARQDVEKLQKKLDEKEKGLSELGMGSERSSTTPPPPGSDQTPAHSLSSHRPPTSVATGQVPYPNPSSFTNPAAPAQASTVSYGSTVAPPPASYDSSGIAPSPASYGSSNGAYGATTAVESLSFGRQAQAAPAQPASNSNDLFGYAPPPAPRSAPAPALAPSAAGMFAYVGQTTPAPAMNDPFSTPAPAPAMQDPFASSTPAPALYDPFAAAPPPQQLPYDPFAAKHTPASDDPFAGL